MRRFRALSVLAPILLLAACDIEDFDAGARVKEDFHYSYALKPGARVELEGFNGAIEIRGWDKDAIDIDGTKTAPDNDRLHDIKIDIVNAPDSVRIRAVRPAERRGNMGVSFVLSVPRKIVLDRVHSSNGAIRVEGIEGNARLRSSNGGVRLADVKGDIDVSTSNGSVNLSRFSGGAVLHTSNGSIHADGVRGSFEATTSNGSVDARVSEPAPGRPIRVETSNGRIVLELETLKDTDVYAGTSNSSLTLKLPSSTNARLKASTSNSSIDTEFEVTARGSISKNRLEGNIGSGGPLLDLHSSNGSIRIQKI